MGRVTLNADQRAELESLLASSEDLLLQRRARILILADDRDGSGLEVDEIAERLGVGRALVENTCRRLEQKGLDAALKRRPAEALALPPMPVLGVEKGPGLAMVAGERPVDIRILCDSREVSARLEAGRAATIPLPGLAGDRRLEYRVEAEAGDLQNRYEGSLVTGRSARSSFRFALLADVHLPAFVMQHWIDPQSGPLAALMRFGRARSQVVSVFRQVLKSIDALDPRPDFVVSLGDLLHLASSSLDPRFPFPNFAEAYADLRKLTAGVAAHAPWLTVMGNWDGESGWIDESCGAPARRARLAAFPQPGSKSYFSWTWGDALFVVLDVTGFTPEAPRLDDPDDPPWTLGDEQMRWLEQTLERSNQPVKLLFMHHALAGNGGDDRSTAYARGGGRAARIGEQARVHELAVRHGVQAIFLGHDHVFVDMVVDGVHYSLPGSAGAPWKFTGEATGYDSFDRRSGFAVIEVATDGLEVEWRDVHGEIFGGYRVPLE